MSHTALTYHIVMGTYCRRQTIDIPHEKVLYKFLHNYSNRKGVFIRRIGGMPDHVHILCDIPPTMTVAGYIQTLKSESSKFMKACNYFPLWEKWAEKYGAFSVEPSLREVKRRYIMNQKEHHRHISFAEEYRALLREAGLDDETEILGDPPSDKSESNNGNEAPAQP